MLTKCTISGTLFYVRKTNPHSGKGVKMEIVYWAYVSIADSGMFLKVSKDDYCTIVNIAKRGCGYSEKFDNELNLTKCYAEDTDGHKNLVCMKQVFTEENEND